MKFAAADDPSKNSTAVGLRYNLADSGTSGWRMQLSENGEWRLRIGANVVTSGEAALKDGWNSIKIEAADNTIRGYINGELVTETTTDMDEYVMQPAGRAALYSSYYQNCFDNVAVEPVEGFCTYVTRLDSTDSDKGVTLDGDWSHSLMDSFKNYKRTVSTSKPGASLTVEFDGTGIILVGAEKEGTVIDTELDETAKDTGYAVPKTANRQSFYNIYGLENGHHTLTVTVREGSLALDSAEILLDNSDAAKLFASAQTWERTENADDAVQTQDEVQSDVNVQADGFL